jgi:hypothetical protein
LPVSDLHVRLLIFLLLITSAPLGSAEPASLPTVDQAEPKLWTFRSEKAALRFLLKRERPDVLGLGEYHQKTGGPKVASSLSRFTRAFLPLLRKRASDLVIETWITAGNCGKEEKKVIKDVDKTTKRPEKTESELVTLIKRARKYHIKPHILEMTCKDYKFLLTAKGKVAYERLLAMTGERLRDKVLSITKVRHDPVKRAVDDSMRAVWSKDRGAAAIRDLVLVYGGGLHNDLHPAREVAAWSYAPAVQKGIGNKRRYIELDVFVPEYIERDKTLLINQRWFEIFKRQQSRRKTLLFQRADRSYVMVFARSARKR